MTTALLIVLLTLSGARKEALKRWPAGTWTLKVNQTGSKHVYELRVVVNQVGVFPSLACGPKPYEFTGSSWQSVFDASKDVKSTCVPK